jgi:DNA-directed RNA polymerase III subunit RPC6
MAPTAPNRKRPAAANKDSEISAAPSKKARADAPVKTESIPILPPAGGPVSTLPAVDPELMDRFVALFAEPAFTAGISNSALKEKFGEGTYIHLVPCINELTQKSRLVMSKLADGELFYSMVSDEIASKFTGLDSSARMVYQVIERAGDKGIWTKDVRIQTNIQQQALNKIFKGLESRHLIKPVKSVTAKSKKLYMAFHLTPSKELTGGVWYSDLEFDHEFISELRTFLLHCVRRLNSGRGVTLAEIRDKMVQANVSRVQLSVKEIQQIMQTLVYDYIIELADDNEKAEVVYVAAKRITPMCDFKWWDALSPDFHFRAIQFEDGVALSAHEPHYHS